LFRAGCGAGAATAAATTNESAAGGRDGPVPKQSAAAADAGALAEASTQTTQDKLRPMGGKNAAFNTNTKRRAGGPWEGNAQALTPSEAQQVAASVAGCGAGAANAAATTNEVAVGECDGPVSKQAAAAAGAGALAEASTRATEDKWRSIGGENASFNTNTKRRTGGP
jgi:hypothetical protein